MERLKVKAKMILRFVLGLLFTLTILQCGSALIVPVSFIPFVNNKVHHNFLFTLKAEAEQS